MAVRARGRRVGNERDGLRDRELPSCAACIFVVTLAAGVCSRWRRRRQPLPSDRASQPVYLFGIPVDFILFGLTLLGVALFHHHTLSRRADRAGGHHALQAHLHRLQIRRRSRRLRAAHAARMGDPGQPVPAADGFALLSRHFELSRVPDAMPAYLPDDWKGGVALLAIVFVLSSFLDNIAAALIGGTMARHVFRGKVHIGYLAAIVAASNAGGSGSVVGDTTTTMMWIDGVSPLSVVEAYVAASVALAIFARPGRAPAASLLADRQGGAGRPADRVDPRRHRRRDPDRRDPGQCHRQPQVSGAARPHSR